MKVEDLNQEDFEHLMKCGQQRAVMAAAIVNAMNKPATCEEALAIKRTLMIAMSTSLSMGLGVRDEIERDVLISMKDHCTEQIEIEELLESTKDE